MTGCLEICQAACCQDIDIQLSKDEYQSLLRKGGRVFESWDEGTYKLRGKCPNLIDNRCSVYKTDEQPKICRQYGFMGYGCRKRRFYHSSLVKFYLPGELEAGQELDLSAELKLLPAFLIGQWPWSLEGSRKP